MPDTAEHLHQRQRAAIRCGTAGVVGALTCTLACCLPAVLLALGAGSSAAGMAGMDHAGHRDHGALDSLLQLLHRVSPALLIGSIALIAAAFALRRPVAALLAVLAGVVLYVSVHVQSDPLLMYAGMAVGYGSWIALYLWTRPARKSGTE